MVQVPINKLSKTVEVDFDSLPDNAKEYVITYGLKQVLNDSHSAYRMAKPEEEAEGTVFDNVEEFQEAVQEVIDAKVEALMDGSVTIRTGVSRAPVDPVGKEAYRLAQGKVKDMLKNAGYKLRDLPKGKLGDMTQEHLDKNSEHYRKLAERNLSAVQEIDINLDLDEIMAA